MNRRSGPVEPVRVALAIVGGLSVGVLAFTERFAELPAAAVAYAAGWWVLGLAQDAPAGTEEH